jgi:hypothetical protein
VFLPSETTTSTGVTGSFAEQRSGAAVTVSTLSVIVAWDDRTDHRPRKYFPEPHCDGART